MDSHDLFRQLTKGARFSRSSITDAKVSAQSSRASRTSGIKQETTISSEDSGDDAADFESEEEKCTFQFTDGCKVEMMDTCKKDDSGQENIAMLRKDNRIMVRGKNIPPPVTTFEELRTQYKISEQLVKNMFALKYVEPTPIQMQAIPILLHGRPLMAAAPTGSGKTIAYLMPILNMLGAPKNSGSRVIVVAPTLELSHQIYRECVQLATHTGLKIHMVSKLTQTLQKYESYLNKRFDVLVSTPNRVRYLVQQQPPLLNLQTVEWFVIDEADRLLEDGKNNFKDQLDGILETCTNPDLKLVMFSATYTASVAKWALRNVKNLVRVIVGQQNSTTHLVDQELLFVGSESGKLLAVRDMVRTGLKPPVLIFVQSKDRAKELFQELLYDGINVDVIHADRTQQQRDNCVRAFREGSIWVLICTELMGRGIDFKGVNLVINYDFPPSVISYIHRIGRTGRAGRRGKAITFFTQSDTRNLRSIALLVKNSGGKIPDFTLQLKKPRKTEVQKLANSAPSREPISTQLRPETSGRKHTGARKSTPGPKIASTGAKRSSSVQADTHRKGKKMHIMNQAKGNVVKT